MLVWHKTFQPDFVYPSVEFMNDSSRRWNLMSLSSSGPSSANSALPPISGNNAFLPRPDLCNDLNYFFSQPYYLCTSACRSHCLRYCPLYYTRFFSSFLYIRLCQLQDKSRGQLQDKSRGTGNQQTACSRSFFKRKLFGLFVSASLSDVWGLAVRVIDLINCSLSVLRFVLAFDVCW